MSPLSHPHAYTELCSSFNSRHNYTDLRSDVSTFTSPCIRSLQCLRPGLHLVNANHLGPTTYSWKASGHTGLHAAARGRAGCEHYLAAHARGATRPKPDPTTASGRMPWCAPGRSRQSKGCAPSASSCRAVPDPSPARPRPACMKAKQPDGRQPANCTLCACMLWTEQHCAKCSRFASRLCCDPACQCVSKCNGAV